MRKFIKQHSDAIQAAIDREAVKLDLSDKELRRGHQSFAEVMAFLSTDRARISQIKEKFASKAFFEKAAQRFFKGRYRRELPKLPRTQPDSMVEYILHVAFEYTPAAAIELSKGHRAAMAAENAVGDVLERYIASVLEPQGWTWCSGTLVSTIDFLRYDVKKNKWDVLQIKNRDNSENSSSSGYRKGKAVPSWFRSFAKTGETNWKAFPILVGDDKKLLSERGFRNFVEAFYAPLRAKRR
jgi:hypothetical protein